MKPIFETADASSDPMALGDAAATLKALKFSMWRPVIEVLNVVLLRLRPPAPPPSCAPATKAEGGAGAGAVAYTAAAKHLTASATAKSVDTMGRNVLKQSPWHILGGYKYVIFTPFFIKAIHANLYGGHDVDNWCFHMLLVTLFRLTQAQLWQTFSRLHCLSKKHQIHTSGVTYEQVDREFHSDDHMILQVLAATVAHVYLPGFRHMPSWDMLGLLMVFLLHAGPAEFVYYWLHRAMHTKYFFRNYHSLHHGSVHPEPATGGVSTFLEHIVLYAGVMGIPLIGTVLLGRASIGMIYAYWLIFDFLKYLAHCNVEIVPMSAFRALPALRYFLITPSYHYLHHNRMDTNYCLFIPLYDHIGGTMNPSYVELHTKLRRGRKEKAPDFVFLAHCIDLCSSMHVSFMFRTLAAQAYSSKWYLLVVSPCVVPFMFILWVWAGVFVAYQYILDDVFAQTWVVPRYGFQYFIPFKLDSINRLIEKAILDADKAGVKVISLGALNKNESLNGGGKLFVDKHEKNLRVRVVHGNTLTAACIIRAIDESVKEVFLTGATSKLGRAIALYFCRRKIRVLMLTSSQERYDAIVKEAPPDLKHYLVRVTKYQAGKNCKTWIMGKWVANADQQWAPSGTHFHQFVVPPVPSIRKDCTYGKLAAMRVPKQVKGMSSCEGWCDRSVVHACHAGGLVHCLEGWTHHEVGSIDVDRIDIVWAAAMKHQFRLNV